MATIDHDPDASVECIEVGAFQLDDGRFFRRCRESVHSDGVHCSVGFDHTVYVPALGLLQRAEEPQQTP